MDNGCREKPTLKLIEGIEQFNRGEYYECHETLEEIWRETQGEIRDLLPGARRKCSVTIMYPASH